MIVVHHLESSRSARILWLLEELGLDYEVVHYARDPLTARAPASLRAVHPLGKSPVIEDGELVLAESGAIVDYLVCRYGEGRLSPDPHAPEFPRYLYWLHFAEGSGIFPLLLDLMLGIAGAGESVLAPAVREEIERTLDSVADALADCPYLAGEEFTAADVLMSFVLEFAEARGHLDTRADASAYLARLRERPAYRRAQERARASA